jgi:hypothetical protein
MAWLSFPKKEFEPEFEIALSEDLVFGGSINRILKKQT